MGSGGGWVMVDLPEMYGSVDRMKAVLTEMQNTVQDLKTQNAELFKFWMDRTGGTAEDGTTAMELVAQAINEMFGMLTGGTEASVQKFQETTEQTGELVRRASYRA